MDKLRPPTVPEQETPVLSTDDTRALLTVCAGRDFGSIRDTAIIRTLLDTGMRLDKLAVARPRPRPELAYVMGQGRRPRSCPFGHKAVQALDR